MTDAGTRPSRFGAGPLRVAACLLAGVLSCFVGVRDARAQVLGEKPKALDGVTLEEHLGAQLPTQLELTNSDGERVALNTYFDGKKPVVLAFVYFGCPVVCPLVMDRMTECFSGLDYTIGEDFNVVIVSIDPTEGVTESNARKERDLSVYGRGLAGPVADGWAYLTGDEQTVRQLADTCGWKYKRLANGEYAHPAAIMVLSPEAKISRYVYGFDYPVKQIKLSLIDASNGKLAKSLGDQLLCYCYRYDPTAGAYSVEAMAVMRLAGGLTVAALIVLIGGLLIVEKVRKSRRASAVSA